MECMRRLKKDVKDARGILTDQRGVLLLSMAMVLAVAAAFAAVAVTRTVRDKRSTDIRAENLKSFYAAQAGEQAMKATIRQDALVRFAAAQAAWPGTGAILTNPANFFANQVTLPGVRLPTGPAFPACVPPRPSCSCRRQTASLIRSRSRMMLR